MKTQYLIFVLFLSLGMTSCSLSDEEIQDKEQISLVASDSDDPPLEETGEEEELEPNN